MFVKLYKFVIQQFQNQKNVQVFLNPKIRRLDFPNLYTNEIRNFQNLKFRKSKFSRSRIPHLTAKEQCADMRDVLPLDKLTELTFFEEEIVKAMDGPDGIIERLQGYCCHFAVRNHIRLFWSDNMKNPPAGQLTITVDLEERKPRQQRQLTCTPWSGSAYSVFFLNT